MDTLPFFVYGTLKPGGSNYARFLAGRTSYEHDASISAAALYTDGRLPFMVLGGDLARPDDAVGGVLIGVHDELFTATLATLDALEGYTPGGLANYYVRVRVAVSAGGERRPAWTYLAGPRVLARIRAGRLSRLDGVWHVDPMIS